jgi:hypothetical protein
MRVAVMAAVLVGDEAWSGREELGLPEGLHVGVVQVALELPGGRVIRTRGNSGVSLRAESEPETAGVKLQVEGAVRVRAYSAEP